MVLMASWLIERNTRQMWDSTRPRARNAALPCSHVFWRRHGGARECYNINSEMGQRCDVWLLSASCSPKKKKINPQKSGRAEALERKFTAVSSRQLIGCEGAQQRLIGLLRTKTSLQVPPPSWHVTWRSKARGTTLRPPLPPAPEPSLDGTAHRLWQEAQEAGPDHCAWLDFCCHTKAKKWITVNFISS